MKKLVFLPFLLLASVLIAWYLIDAEDALAQGTSAAPRTLAAPACSGFYGTMKATNWPGGKLTLTCPGKNRPRGKCIGASAQLSPGQGFSFNNCNCLDPKTKCLTVSNLPPGCQVKEELACASNREVVDGSFQVECTDATASPCETTPSQPAMGTSLAPSFVCLGLGEVGGCLTPTPNPDCVPPIPSDIIPSDIPIIPSDAVPSDSFIPTP